MKYLYSSIVLFVSVLLVNCSGSVSQSDLQLINGYWEIEKVEMPEGEVKDYSMNMTVDYFEIDQNGVGFRQKVIPQINGTYETNEVPEKVEIKEVDKVYWMDYKTDYATWKEQLLSVNQEKLVVKNTHDFIYHYKRSTPLKIE